MNDEKRFRTMVMGYAKDLAVAYKPDIANLDEFIKVAHTTMVNIIEAKGEKKPVTKPTPPTTAKEEPAILTTDSFGGDEEDMFFVDENEMRVKTLKSELNKKMDEAKVPNEHKKPLYDFVVEGTETIERLENFVKHFGDGLMAYKKFILAQKSK